MKTLCWPKCCYENQVVQNVASRLFHFSYLIGKKRITGYYIRAHFLVGLNVDKKTFGNAEM
jgi:hypothetical protein